MRIGLLAPLLLAVASSCAVVYSPGKSPLAHPQMSPDSVVLDIFFVRVPLDQEDVNGRLWEEIDEQHLPPEVRRQLAKSGFRAGVAAGQIPAALARLMELKDKPPASVTEARQVSVAEMASDPHVVQRHLQCRTGQRTEILASDIYDELPVLTSESGGLCGQTYRKAQGVLAAKAVPLPDGRVRLDLSPELHYGEPKQRFVGDQGAMRMETGRPRRVFDNLALSATLAPGHIFVMSSLTTRPGSLGYQFFTSANSGRREQKLLVVRLAQTQHDELFDPDSVLSLENADQQPAGARPETKAKPGTD